MEAQRLEGQAYGGIPQAIVEGLVQKVLRQPPRPQIKNILHVAGEEFHRRALYKTELEHTANIRVLVPMIEELEKDAERLFILDGDAQSARREELRERFHTIYDRLGVTMTPYYEHRKQLIAILESKNQMTEIQAIRDREELVSVLLINRLCVNLLGNIGALLGIR